MIHLVSLSLMTTLDPGAASQVQSKSVQTVDIYGNLTQQKVYDYGNLTTPARTYNLTYLADGNYTSRYIRNRLAGASVTTSAGTITLVSESYDTTGIYFTFQKYISYAIYVLS